MEIVYNRFHLYNSIPMHYIYIYIPILLVPKDCYDSNFELNDSNDLDFLNHWAQKDCHVSNFRSLP